jgi:hypothetical protein
MNRVIPKSPPTPGLDVLGEPYPWRRKVLHITRGSWGRLLEEILEYQMEQSDITMVSLEGERGALEARDLSLCRDTAQGWRGDGSREIGYPELLDLILDADRIFVW